MSEGSLEAPIRHPIPWKDREYTDPGAIDAELRRVFDICHTCRRCFNLCDSFPRLFDLIDDSESGELDAVDSGDFKPVVDACTLCDMCFMTKCPYVPPHEFDLDFPHLMLRYRAMEQARGDVSFIHRQINETDRNGKLAGVVAPLANWGTDRRNRLTRPVLEVVAGIHRDADLPKFHAKTLVKRSRAAPPVLNTDAPAHGRKAVLFATCFANYNNPDIGLAAAAVLARNGVECETVYPGCCGMPQLEQGDIARVAASAQKIAAELSAWIDKGYRVIALVPSCALMLKFEYPLILPDDPNVQRLSAQTSDICEYVVDIAKNEGLAGGLSPLSGPVALHLACHARAQNMGPKAAEMLNLIPDAEVKTIERCSGHGGAWGILKENFEIALKIGRPAAKTAAESGAQFIVSECPLAREHIAQGMENLAKQNLAGENSAEDGAAPAISPLQHPIQVMARAYGIE